MRLLCRYAPRNDTAPDFLRDHQNLKSLNIDELVKSLFKRHPGESRGPEHLEITGFRLSPE
jgi:hypothetical protein